MSADIATVSQFVLARVEEKKAEAHRAAATPHHGCGWSDAQSERVLYGCAATRQLVLEAVKAHKHAAVLGLEPDVHRIRAGTARGLLHAVQTIALSCSAHPEYRAAGL